jgi:hypothetical protein
LQDYTCKTVCKVAADDLSLIEGPWLDTNRLFFRSKSDLFVVEGDQPKERLLCQGFHPIAKNGQNIFRGQHLCLVHDRELGKVAGNSYLPSGSLSLVFMDVARQQRRETDLDSCFTGITGLELDLGHKYCAVVGSCKRNACISIYSFDQTLTLAASSTRAFENFSGLKRFPLTNTLVVSGKASLFVYSFSLESARPSLELLREFKLSSVDEVADFTFLRNQLLLTFEGRKDLTLVDICQPQQKHDWPAALVQELNQLGVKRTSEEKPEPPAAVGEPLQLEKSQELTLPAGNFN